VELQNQGTTPLNAVNIHWTVNGVEQPAFAWAGNLPAAANTNINIGNYDLTAGTLYQLQAWTTLSVGSNDCNHLNDTCQTLNVGLPLCGTYTLGGPGANFPNFTEAAYALNTFGVACPVTILVNNGTYNERVTLYDFPGSSAINTVTFQGASGDSSLVNFTSSGIANQTTYTLSLTGTKYTLFKYLNISATNGGNAIRLIGGLNNIKYENCILKDLLDSRESSNREITFKNNRITNVFNFALYLGNSYRMEKITFENNQLNNSLYLNACDTVIFHKNTLVNKLIVENSSEVKITENSINGKIESSYSNYLKISKNTLQNSLIDDYGDIIYIGFTTNFKITNNIIDGTNSNELSGINLFYSGANNDSIVNNEIKNVHYFGINTSISFAILESNRITNIEGGSSIYCYSSNITIINNFIHNTGINSSKGISIQYYFFNK
jgi:hypothetical protein